MAHYIDKDALVAEIKRYKHKADERLKIKGRTLAEDLKDSALQNLCGNLIYFLDTLDVKEVQESTAVDRGMTEEIIINLKRVEKDYRIDLTREIEWLRNKVKKGE